MEIVRSTGRDAGMMHPARENFRRKNLISKGECCIVPGRAGKNDFGCEQRTPLAGGRMGRRRAANEFMAAIEDYGPAGPRQNWQLFQPVPDRAMRNL